MESLILHQPLNQDGLRATDRGLGGLALLFQLGQALAEELHPAALIGLGGGWSGDTAAGPAAEERILRQSRPGRDGRLCQRAHRQNPVDGRQFPLGSATS